MATAWILFKKTIQRTANPGGNKVASDSTSKPILFGGKSTSIDFYEITESRLIWDVFDSEKSQLKPTSDFGEKTNLWSPYLENGCSNRKNNKNLVICYGILALHEVWSIWLPKIF